MAGPLPIMGQRCTMVLAFQFLLTLSLLAEVGALMVTHVIEPTTGLPMIGMMVAIWLPSPMVDTHLDHMTTAVVNALPASMARDAVGYQATVTPVETNDPPTTRLSQ